MTRLYGAKKDANHQEIVNALRDAGCHVLDVSTMGGGFPDLIVCRGKETLLVEIKNPNTGYGKRGANRLQKAWANGWPGAVYIIRTIAEVAEFVNHRPVQMVVPRP